MTLALSADPILTPYTRVQSNATGEVAERLAKFLLDVAGPDRNKATDWRPVLQARIEDLAAECASANWDGYGALPITNASKRVAQHLVEVLPVDLPEPDATADPDGEISLVWDFGPNCLFTLSVGSSEVVSYAGIIGKGKKRHGEEPFSGDVPKILVESVREIAPAR